MTCRQGSASEHATSCFAGVWHHPDARGMRRLPGLAVRAVKVTYPAPVVLPRVGRVRDAPALLAVHCQPAMCYIPHVSLWGTRCGIFPLEDVVQDPAASRDAYSQKLPQLSSVGMEVCHQLL